MAAQRGQHPQQSEQDQHQRKQGQRDRYRKTKKQVLAHIIPRSEALNLPLWRLTRLSPLNNLLRNFCRRNQTTGAINA
jgi:hypothetical protein